MLSLKCRNPCTCLVIVFIIFYSSSDDCASVSAVSCFMPCSVLSHSDGLGSNTCKRSASWVVWPSSVHQMCFIALTQTELLSKKRHKTGNYCIQESHSNPLQQKEVNLTLVSYCINQFDGGFFAFYFPTDVKMED